ncbi:MAG: hypothetical protein ABIF12_00550 [bacterium]
MKKNILLLTILIATTLVTTTFVTTRVVATDLTTNNTKLNIFEGQETKYLVIKPEVYNAFNNAFSAIDPASTIHLEAHRILSNIKESYYEHSTTVDETSGIYNTDCSGLAAYILRYALNSHYLPIDAAKITGQTRPLASDFCQFFRSLSNEYDTITNISGWMRVKYLRNIKPGDIIAWDYVDEANENTGHVVIVDTITEKFTTSVTINSTSYWEYKVRVIDASSGTHYQDTRELTTNVTGQGIGAGYMYFGVNSTGEIKYYKWSSRSGTPHFEIFGIGRAIPIQVN